MAASYGLVLAAVCIPLLWLAAGFALALSTAIAGLLLGPQLQDGAAVRMWSLDFARWWLICKLSGVTNGLFLRHFRGTAVIPWFMRLMVSCPALNSDADEQQLPSLGACVGFRHDEHQGLTP